MMADFYEDKTDFFVVIRNFADKLTGCVRQSK